MGTWIQKIVFLIVLQIPCVFVPNIEETSSPFQEQKNNIFKSLKQCLKLCEEVVVEVIHKELTHILKHLPKWIDKLTKIKIKSLFESIDVESQNTFFSVVEWLNQRRLSCRAPFPTPLLNEYTTLSSEKHKKEYISFLCNSPQTALNFFEEVLKTFEYSVSNTMSSSSFCKSYNCRSIDDKTFYTLYNVQ